MITEAQLEQLDADALRGVVRGLLTDVARKGQELDFKQALIDKLTHEMAVLKRLKFAAQSERLHGAFNAEQKSLLEETLEADLAALALEIEQAEQGDAAPGAKTDAKTPEKRQPKREALPSDLPRREIAHEPDSTTCACGCAMKRIGEDVAEKLDYVPGVFTVERHVRGKWVCSDKACGGAERIVQAAVAPHIIDMVQGGLRRDRHGAPPSTQGIHPATSTETLFSSARRPASPPASLRHHSENPQRPR